MSSSVSAAAAARAMSLTGTKSAYEYTYNKADNQSQDYFAQLENIAKKQPIVEAVAELIAHSIHHNAHLFYQKESDSVFSLSHLLWQCLTKPGGPKNFFTNPKLPSQVEPSLFQVPSSILQGDPYRDTFKGKQISDKQRVDSIPHGQPFKPTDVYKSKIGAQYEHMKDYDDKTYRTRDENGTIITGPKNFMTNPNKRGLGNTTVGHLFNPVSYGSDPYHRAQEFDVV